MIMLEANICFHKNWSSKQILALRFVDELLLPLYSKSTVQQSHVVGCLEESSDTIL